MGHIHTQIYTIPAVSTEHSAAVGYPDLTNPIVDTPKDVEHRIYRISLAVENTNRAAMSEWLLVMRPKPSGSRSYQYLERTAVVHNQVGNEDVNTPHLFFQEKQSVSVPREKDYHLMVRLSGMTAKQRVLVWITEMFNSHTSKIPAADQSYARI